ncbi:helix-turn-helix domain-containing protein, partial [Streptosporangium algeriense]
MVVPEHQDGARPGSHGDVGARMRRFRKERGLTLRDLAAASGLSIGFLSQVERGISAIGLTALNGVAAALGRGVADFFGDEPRQEE